MKIKGNAVNRISMASTGRCAHFPIILDLNIPLLKY